MAEQRKRPATVTPIITTSPTPKVTSLLSPFATNKPDKDLVERLNKNEINIFTGLNPALIGSSVRTSKPFFSMFPSGNSEKKFQKGFSSSKDIKAITEEKEVKKKLPVIDPFHIFRRLWDGLTAIFVLYVVVTLPLFIAMDWIDFSSADPFDDFMTAWFAIDIILNFNTGFIRKGVYEDDRKQIAFHYLKGWFLIDLLGTVPFELMFQNAFSSQSATVKNSIHSLKYFKLPKLLRLGRLVKIAKQYGKIFQLIFVAFSYLICCHVFTCVYIWAYSPCANAYDLSANKPTPTTDDPAILAYCQSPSDMYFQLHLGVSSMMIGIDSIVVPGTYFPFAPPTPNDSFIIALTVYKYFLQMVGFVFVALFLAEIALMFASRVGAHQIFRNKLHRVKKDMHYFNIPTELQAKINSYYDYLWEHEIHLNDNFLMNDPELSDNIKNSLALYLYKDLISIVTFLKDANDDFLGKLCMSLKIRIYMPDDYVIKKGDVARELFIVGKGELVLLSNEDPDNKTVIARLYPGNFFGEGALMEETKTMRRKGTIVAATICEVFLLPSHLFYQICDEYPEFREKMVNLAEERATLDKLKEKPVAVGKEQKNKRRISSILDDEDEQANSHSHLLKVILDLTIENKEQNESIRNLNKKIDDLTELMKSHIKNEENRHRIVI